MLFKTEVRWFFTEDSYVLERMFRTLTSLKFQTLFLSEDCLSIGETDAIFTLLGKNPLEILLFIASTSGWESTSADILTSLGGILSVAVAFLSSIFWRCSWISKVVPLWNWNCSAVCELSKFCLILMYARVTTIILHYFVNDLIIFHELDSKIKSKGFCLEDFSTIFM